jgi:predicted dienelactone hydrolase
MEMKHFLHAGLMIALLCLTSGLVFAQAVTPESRANTPQYAAPGPYSVGRTWFSVSNGTEMPLILVAWYPAVKQDGNQQTATLNVPEEYRLSDIKTEEGTGDWGAAILNAAPDNSQAPYPLVIFSTGAFTTPAQYAYLEEHLASYGFIVVTNANPDEEFSSSFITRAMAVPQEIDFAENLNHEEGSFKGLIDPKHTGMVGHSLGGYTALAAVGARLNLAGLQTWCADHKTYVASDFAIDFACPDLLSHTKEMSTLAHLSSTPTSLWPSWDDPRISAIVSQSAPGFVFGSSGLASVTVPVMIQFGSNDSVVYPEWAGYKTYANISSPQKTQVVFENGNHVMFGTGGDDIEPPVWIANSAHDLINHFTTAFLLDMLKDNQEAHRALLPNAVSFPGITYTTTMK